MDRKKIAPILLSILLAGIATYGVMTFLEQNLAKQKNLNQVAFANNISILVAADNLQAGQTLKKIDLAWRVWPKGQVPAGSFIKDTMSLGDILDAIVLQNIIKGTPINTKMLMHPRGKNPILGLLKPNMRAVSIPVDDITGVAGFILPGDTVDLLYTGNNERLQTIVLAKNINVLATDQSMHIDNPKSGVLANTITIAVSKKQLPQIVNATLSGKITISLQGVIN